MVLNEDDDCQIFISYVYNNNVGNYAFCIISWCAIQALMITQLYTRDNMLSWTGLRGSLNVMHEKYPVRHFRPKETRPLYILIFSNRAVLSIDRETYLHGMFS